MLKSGRLVPGGVFVFLLSFFLASSSVAAGLDFGTPGGTLPPARPGALNAVPNPKALVPLTQTQAAPPAAVGTVLATKGFAFSSSLGATDTAVAQFAVPGPGKVILEASNTQTPLAKLGLIARAPKPVGQTPVDTRWDGPTPLRVEFPVTAQDLANLPSQGNVWTVFVTLRGPNGILYPIPGLAAVGELKVSFVASAPAQQTVLQSKTLPNVAAARAASVAPPAATLQGAPVKAVQPAPAVSQPALKTAQPAPAAAQPVATAPQAAGNPAPKTSQPAPAAAIPVEPTWPQPFELGPGERTGFGFVAGTPGPIVVTVQWTGVPLTVSLVKPGGGTVGLQGKGTVALKYNATAADVKKGVLWSVSIRPTQAAPKSAAGAGIAVIDKPVKISTSAVAKGTVNVQHPPGDVAQAQVELKAMAAKAQALQPASKPAASAMVNVRMQKQAAMQKQQAVRQAALLEQVRSKIPVQAYQQMSQQIALAGKPGAVSSQSSAMTASSGIPLVEKTGVAVKATGTSVPAPAVIRLMEHSLSTGQPGDPVLLVGSGFSNVPGEVHFIVANGKDVVAPATFWSDTQIIVPVPDVSGILAFDGQVYVKRGASMSNPLPFRFEPAMEYRTLVLKKGSDRDFEEMMEPSNLGQIINFHSFVFFEDSPWEAGMLILLTPGTPAVAAVYSGQKRDISFAPRPRLKNGWVADSAYLSMPGTSGGIQVIGSADAYISQYEPGTDLPWLVVHMWVDFNSGVRYSPYIVIKGPKGVAY